MLKQSVGKNAPTRTATYAPLLELVRLGQRSRDYGTRVPFTYDSRSRSRKTITTILLSCTMDDQVKFQTMSMGRARTLVYAINNV